jgi:hypothetical protein
VVVEGNVIGSPRGLCYVVRKSTDTTPAARGRQSQEFLEDVFPLPH